MGGGGGGGGWAGASEGRVLGKFFTNRGGSNLFYSQPGEDHDHGWSSCLNRPNLISTVKIVNHTILKANPQILPSTTSTSTIIKGIPHSGPTLPVRKYPNKGRYGFFGWGGGWGWVGRGFGGEGPW